MSDDRRIHDDFTRTDGGAWGTPASGGAWSQPPAEFQTTPGERTVQNILAESQRIVRDRHTQPVYLAIGDSALVTVMSQRLGSSWHVWVDPKADLTGGRLALWVARRLGVKAVIR